MDGRSWPFERRFRALDYAFCVRTDLEDAGLVVGRLLAPFVDPKPYAPAATYTLTHRLTPGPRDDRDRYCYELFHDADSIQRVANPGSMLDMVILDVTRRAVESTNRYLAVHAGVVALHGQALLLSAPADSGKTTLVAGLTRVGFDFLGDEIALLEPGTGLVHPFFRPLMIERPSMDVLDGLASELPAAYEGFRATRYQVSSEDLRPGSKGTPSPVAFVAFPSFHAGLETRLRPISRAAAMIRLAGQAFNMLTMGKAAIETFADVIRGAECFELPMGDLHQAIGEIRGLFEPGDRRSQENAGIGAVVPSGMTR